MTLYICNLCDVKVITIMLHDIKVIYIKLCYIISITLHKHNLSYAM